MSEERRLKGTGIGSAVAIGPAYVYGCQDRKIEERSIDVSEIANELGRFRKAVADSRKELEQLRDRVARNVGQMEGAIFDAHITMLEDPLLLLEVTRAIRTRQINAEAALSTVMDDLMEQLGSVDDELIRSRTADISDVGRRILKNLGSPVCSELGQVSEPSIIVAHDLSPSETAQMDPEMVLGFVTELGTHTSHTAIFAKALGIPAVVGVMGALEEVEASETVIVDSAAGDVILSAAAGTQSAYRVVQEAFASFDDELLRESRQDSVTTDGVHVDLAANIEIPAELAIARDHHAKGIGLYRTEFLFMNRASFPDEEEQYHYYKQAAEVFPDDPVTIRTIDVGGDKFVSNINTPPEMNPFLGMRAIRLSLHRPDLFEVQLRAVLRASVHGKIRLMLPMVSTLEEVEATLFILQHCKNQLRERKQKFDDKMPVGIMVETPAAAMITDILAEQVDFFSIGTNDLIQYTMAADRVNEWIGHLYQPLHLGVLRLLRKISENARRAGVEVSMCGEMASDPLFAPVVVGLGIKHLSMSARAIPHINRLIRTTSYTEMKEVAAEALAMRSDSDVRNMIRNRFGEKLAHLKPQA